MRKEKNLFLTAAQEKIWLNCRSKNGKISMKKCIQSQIEAICKNRLMGHAIQHKPCEWRIIDEETVKETNDMSVSSGNGTVFPYGIPGWHIWNTWYGTDSTCGNNHGVEAGR